MKGVVVTEVGAKCEVWDIDLADVQPGQVRVQVKSAGVCHSDLSGQNGTIPYPTPVILGHEGAGIVTAVGPGVTTVEEGDHVVFNWTPFCDNCFHCKRGEYHLCAQGGALSTGAITHLKDGSPVFPFASVGTFAEETVCPANAVVPIAKDVPFDIAALVGCGVATGVGAAMNTAKIVPGSTVVVFGCGGVGINVIQGAKLCGASAIVAVDKLEEKREWAKRFGATHAVGPDDVKPLADELTDGFGFDYAFEAIGLSATIRASYDATRRGGTTVVVGVGRMEDFVQFSAFEFFYNERKLLGCMYGSCNVRHDFDRLLSLWRGGQLDLEGLISRRIKLDEVEDAFSAMERGEVIRQVIDF